MGSEGWWRESWDSGHVGARETSGNLVRIVSTVDVAGVVLDTVGDDIVRGVERRQSESLCGGWARGFLVLVVVGVLNRKRTTVSTELKCGETGFWSDAVDDGVV